MRIQHNIPAMSSYRNYSRNVSAVNKNLEKLSSGYKINRAGDDAAGLAISEKMRLQIAGLEQAQNNAKSGINLVQTAEGALTEVHDMLNRMYTLAEQSANGTYSNEVDREQLQKEVDSLRTEINRIADATNFNGINLLDGTMGMDNAAFSIETGTEALKAKKAEDVAGAFTGILDTAATPVKGNNTILHKDGTEAREGSFSIDLSQLNYTADGAAAATFELTVGGAKVATTAALADANTGADAEDIATALETALNGSANGGIAIGTDGAVATADLSKTKGALLYTVERKGTTLTFTATKYSDGKNWVELEDNLPVNDVADNALKSPEFKVGVATAAGTAKNLTGAENLGATNITKPDKLTRADFGNTKVTFDITKVASGQTMTIAGVSKTIGGDGSDIRIDDLQDDLDGTDATKKTAAQTELRDRITRAFAGHEGVSVGFDSDGKMTIAEKVDADGKSTASAEVQKAMEKKEDFAKLFKLQTPAASAGTKLTVTDASVKDKTGITVGDNTYIFTKDAAKAGTSEGTTKYVKLEEGKNAENLKEALEKDGWTVENDNGALIIRSNDFEADAPAISGKGLTLQIGDTADDFNKMTVKVKDMHANSMGIGKIDISSQDGASDAMAKIKAATNYVSDVRGSLGALQNRLDHTINNLSVTQENIQDAESTIRDVDIAKEMMAYTKNNILVQSAQAMLAQANQLPQGVLQLLG